MAKLLKEKLAAKADLLTIARCPKTLSALATQQGTWSSGSFRSAW